MFNEFNLMDGAQFESNLYSIMEKQNQEIIK